MAVALHKDLLTPGLAIRREFPIFDPAGTRRLAYLDSAASAQKPRCVIERMAHYLGHQHANVSRGAYQLSAEATRMYEEARTRLKRFLGAKSERSIIFTRNSTEAINLAAYSLQEWFKPGDTILTTLLEHHSNFVPWQLLAQRRGLKLEFVGLRSDASLDLEDLKGKLQKLKPKLLAVTAHSNAFGSLVPVKEIVGWAHGCGTKVLVDGSQSVVHGATDVADLEVDFFAITGHKLYGPTGIGALYVKESCIDLMQPFLGGGGMIEHVATSGTSWAEPPHKFEAGTPAIAEAIGLASALDLIEQVGWEQIQAHERQVFSAAYELLSHEPGVKVIGPVISGGAQASIFGFTVDGVHPHDLASIADDFGAQIRAGHHCAMPALQALGLPATARASIGLYTDITDFECLVQAIRKARTVFGAN